MKHQMYCRISLIVDSILIQIVNPNPKVVVCVVIVICQVWLSKSINNNSRSDFD